MREKPRLGLIDYGSGNLRSVTKALESVRSEIQRISTGPIPQDLDALVLPGVGSFGDSVRQLHRRQLFEPIRSWLEAGKPFLGICLGYQLLFDHSEESPDLRGLGVLAGEVRRFTGSEVKVPQIGWNRVRWSAQTLQQFPELPADPFVYFVLLSGTDGFKGNRGNNRLWWQFRFGDCERWPFGNPISSGKKPDGRT
jgi:imidazole glycerol phosphate synthase glutamine amidotransferase subunit